MVSKRFTDAAIRSIFKAEPLASYISLKKKLSKPKVLDSLATKKKIEQYNLHQRKIKSHLVDHAYYLETHARKVKAHNDKLNAYTKQSEKLKREMEKMGIDTSKLK